MQSLPPCLGSVSLCMWCYPALGPGVGPATGLQASINMINHQTDPGTGPTLTSWMYWSASEPCLKWASSNRAPPRRTSACTVSHTHHITLSTTSTAWWYMHTTAAMSCGRCRSAGCNGASAPACRCSYHLSIVGILLKVLLCCNAGSFEELLPAGPPCAWGSSSSSGQRCVIDCTPEGHRASGVVCGNEESKVCRETIYEWQITCLTRLQTC